MEEYITVQELGERIKFSKQSVYNLIYKKKFTLGIHYLKPTPKKILFVWSEVEKWLRQSMDEPIEIVMPIEPDQNEQIHSHAKNCHTTKSDQKEAHSISAIHI
ncbi:MAG: hypothetical protein WAL90_13685 [Desulfobacterales bacterium]